MDSNVLLNKRRKDQMERLVIYLYFFFGWCIFYSNRYRRRQGFYRLRSVFGKSRSYIYYICVLGCRDVYRSRRLYICYYL